MPSMENDFSRYTRGNEHDNPDTVESVDDDDDAEKDDEKRENRNSRKQRKAILFFGKEDVDDASPDIEKTEEKQKGTEERQVGSLFSGVLREDVEQPVESEVSEADTTVASQQTEELTVTAPELEATEIKEEFQEIVAERIQEVEQELELPTVPDEVEAAQADAAFLTRVDERLDQNIPPEIAIAGALESDVSSAENDITESNDLSQEVSPDLPNEDDDELDPTPLATTAAMTGAVPIPLTNPSRQPRNPTGAGFAGGIGGGVPAGMYGGGYGPISPNTIPQSRAPNRLAQNPNMTPMNEMYYRERNTGRVLLAGIVGYMIGRRGGRKRTEARLQPEINKREERLNNLSEQLRESEQKIRQMVYAAKTETSQPQPNLGFKQEKTSQKTAEKMSEQIASPTQVEKAFVLQQEAQFEEALQKNIDQRELLNDIELTPTDSGMLEQVMLAPLVAAELLYRQNQQDEFAETKSETVIIAPQVEQQKQEVQTNFEKPPISSRSPRTMTVPELLEVAENISIGGVNLRELYQGNRVDVVNMRRVVTEYLQGKNHEKVLRGSLEAFELQRELRHEIKRDDPVSQGSNGGGGGDSSRAQLTFSSNGENRISDTGAMASELGTLQSADEIQPSEEIMLTNKAAVIVGVVTGALLMVVMLLYLNV